MLNKNQQLEMNYDETDVTCDDEKKIAEWYALSNRISELKAIELELRSEICESLFRVRKEGTNTVALKDGYVIKCKQTYTRSIDDSVLSQILPDLIERDLDIQEIVDYKPSLKTASYRKMNETTQLIFDQCLTMRPSMPSIEVVKPKRK